MFFEQAAKDILSIVDYIAADNPEAATKFRSKFLKLALSLQELPHRGSRVKRRPGQLKLILGSYLIYYRIVEKRHMVEIVRFLHGVRIK